MRKRDINGFNKSDLINRGDKKERSAPVSKFRMKNMSEIENRKIQLRIERDHEL